MNGAHDLGGMHGFEAIHTDPDDPLFHADWERRLMAITLACGFLGKWNIDMSRFAREQMPPGAYLETGYYEHWLFGLERLLVEHGMLTPAELATGQAGDLVMADTAVPPLEALDIIREGGNCEIDEDVEASFCAGENVRARNMHPVGHTRLPRYVRGRMGTIEKDYGVFVFPDANSVGQGPAAQHLYNVRFEAQELWGDQASPYDSVSLDLWDSYLERA